MFESIKSIFNSQNGKLKKAKKVLTQVNALETEVESMSYDQIKSRIQEFKEELKILVEEIPEEDRTSMRRPDHDGKGLPANEIAVRDKLLTFMPEMFAFIRETYKREYGIRHYDVQIIGGAYLAEGWKLAEIRTGEGKTMIFTLTMFLYALAGRGAHLVTVNEYLTKRDGEYSGHIADKLGLTVGIVAPGGTSYKFIPTAKVSEVKGEDVAKEIREIGSPTLAGMKGLNLVEVSKDEAYLCDMSFSVNNELGFDYLRDNMTYNLNNISQRELYFCIVDEADSVLIDEARTPLIISSTPSDTDTKMYSTFAGAVRNLEETEDFEVDYKTRSVVLTEVGIDKVQSNLGVENIWSDYSMAHHLENALKAKTLFELDDHYLIREDEVMIVDQFSGRVMSGRRFSEGIHQAIEAKEGVTIQQESQTFATITFQNFFKLYKWVSGASGTVMTESEEFYKIYNLDALAIPTNKPVIRDDKTDLIFKNQDVKYKAVAEEVKERHLAGQPILVGTTSVEKSELVSGYLDQLGVPHQVLNAKYHDREAQIVSVAGQPGAVTVATNMAGRGTDIPLGKGVIEAGGLAVIGTERHDARRIDNQLRGRSGRQGDPGYSRFYVALDDNIMRIMGGDLMEKTVGRLMQDDAPIELNMITKQIETAQTRVEWANFDTRKRLVDYDDVLNQQREIFYSRRRRFLDLTEKAMGSAAAFETGESSENKDSAKTEALVELRSQVKDLMEDETKFITMSQFAGDKHLDEERLTKLVAHVLDLAPDSMIASALDISGGLEGKLKDKLRGLSELETQEILWNGISQMTDNKVDEFGIDFATVSKALMLESMSKHWMEHLETMADIRSGIGLVGYAQRNPLVEYKSQGFKKFQDMLLEVDQAVVRRFFKISRASTPGSQRQLNTNADQITDILTGDREMYVGGNSGTKLDRVVSDIQNESKRQLSAARSAGNDGKGHTIKNEDKIGRNDPCPCGSGKKYKNCGLKNTEEHRGNLAKV